MQPIGKRRAPVHASAILGGPLEQVVGDLPLENVESHEGQDCDCGNGDHAAL